MVFVFQLVMNRGTDCQICGRWFRDRYALYRHTINTHRRRFCLYCAHEEARPSRLWAHYARVDPSVSTASLDNCLYRSENELIIILTSLIQPVTFPTPKGYSPFLETDVMPPWDYIPTPRVELGQQISPWRQVDEVVIEEPRVTEEPDEHIVHLEVAGLDIVDKVKISLEEYRSWTTARNQNEVKSVVHNLIQSKGNTMDDIFLHSDRSVSESGDLVEITDDILINPNDKQIISITWVKDAVEECAPVLEGEEIPTEIRKVRILGRHTQMLVGKGQITTREKYKRQPSATLSCAPPSPEGETMAVSPPLPLVPFLPLPASQQPFILLWPLTHHPSPFFLMLPLRLMMHPLFPHPVLLLHWPTSCQPCPAILLLLGPRSRQRPLLRIPPRLWPMSHQWLLHTIPLRLWPVSHQWLLHTIPLPLWPVSHQWLPRPIPPPLWPVRHRPSRLSNSPYLGLVPQASVSPSLGLDLSIQALQHSPPAEQRRSPRASPPQSPLLHLPAWPRQPVSIPCECRCHHVMGSYCPCRCACSHRNQGMQTDSARHKCGIGTGPYIPPVKSDYQSWSYFISCMLCFVIMAHG